MSGQYVDTTALIDTFCIRVIPGTFTQCDHTRHHSWRHFRLNMNLTTIVKDPDFIAVVEGGGKYINVATFAYFKAFTQSLYSVGEITYGYICFFNAIEQAFYLSF